MQPRWQVLGQVCPILLCHDMLWVVSGKRQGGKQEPGMGYTALSRASEYK